MRNNNKGFTLVELLAAMVILGILIVASAPVFLRMLANNENKMYVDAAKRLVSKAEYQMRVSSDKIEKPDDGDVIAISLIYLDDADFDHSPNDGAYIKEASFVVIKNNGGEYEYAATIIEKMKKGGYKGVELTKSEDLLKRSATKHVKTFQKDEIQYLENNTHLYDYIKEAMGDFGNLSNIYNYPDLADSVIKDTDEPPTIKSVTVSSASNKNYNSLDSLLTLKATDDKTAKSELQVYTSLISYEDALAHEAEDYGQNDQYTKSFDLQALGVVNEYKGDVVTYYVVVKDGKGQIERKAVNYEIHKNAAPVISTGADKCERNAEVPPTSLCQVNTDLHAMPEATLKLTVNDDIDLKEDLKICLTHALDGTNDFSVDCSNEANYKPYSHYFKSGSNTTTYNFGGTPDGRKMQLAIYVLDSMGLITHTTIKYDIYQNKAPKVDEVKLISESDRFTDEDKRTNPDNPIGGHLNVKVKVEASDDFEDDNISIKVKDITTGISPVGVESSSKVYTDVKSDSIAYTLGGVYDGGTRTVRVTATDRYGLSSYKDVTYQVYQNEPPTIKSLKISSAGVGTNGEACPNTVFCPVDNGGSLSTNIELYAEDDIDYSDSFGALKVCVSEDENACKTPSAFNSSAEGYAAYRDKKHSFKFVPNNAAKPYDGATKEVYVAVMDTYNQITQEKLSYKLYKNNPPSISGLNVTTQIDSTLNYELVPEYGQINLKKVELTFNAEDDFYVSTNSADNPYKNELKVIVCQKRTDVEDATETCSSPVNLYTFNKKATLNETTYEGQKYDVTVKVVDTYGESDSKKDDYKMYKDKKPNISYFAVVSTEEKFQSDDVEFKFSVKDPLDKYNVCIGEKSDYDECVADSNKYYKSSTKINGNDFSEQTQTFKLPWGYKGETKDVYFSVKDNYNNKESFAFEYTDYKKCSEKKADSETYDYEPVDEDKVIDAEYCKSKCYYNKKAAQEYDEEHGFYAEDEDGNMVLVPEYAYKQKYFINYNQIISYKDKYLSKTNCEEKRGNIYDCSLYKCFSKDGTTTKFYKAVDIHKKTIEDGWSHKHSDDEEVSHTTYYEIYTITYDKTTGHVNAKLTTSKACPDKYSDGYYVYGNGYVKIDTTDANIKKIS